MCNIIYYNYIQKLRLCQNCNIRILLDILIIYQLNIIQQRIKFLLRI